MILLDFQPVLVRVRREKWLCWRRYLNTKLAGSYHRALTRNFRSTRPEGFGLN